MAAPVGTTNNKQITLSGDAGDLVFYASPEIEESGNSIYISIDDIRAPASIQIWMGSPSRTFTLNARFISRTPAEADQNVKYKGWLQSWRMPKSGGVGAGDSSVPDILNLSGYGDQFMDISVIITGLNISYPIDVDYIDSGTGFSVPIIWPISISLREFHSETDLSGFDYGSYQSGNLPGWS